MWINVDDRLPENDENVICYVRNVGGFSYKWIYYYNPDKKKWYDDSDHEVESTADSYSVLYWQPMPEDPNL